MQFETRQTAQGSSPRATTRAAQCAAEHRLLRRYRAHGDLHAREQLVRRFVPLVNAVTRPYRGRRDFDDVRQVACIGVMKAIERFDPAFGLSLRAYAVPTMRGEVQRHLRDHSWAVRPPRTLQELVLRVGRTIDRLTSERRRSPTAGEVAEELGIDVEDVMEALAAGRSYSSISLDADRETDDGDMTSIGEQLGLEDAELERAEDRADLRMLSAVLTDEERTLLYLRFVEQLTQREIAERVGLSQMSVSRRLRQALERLGAATGTPAGA